MDLKRVIQDIVKGAELEERRAFEVASAIMEGQATECQIAALLVALRMKGETVDEITGFARAMRENAEPIVIHCDNVMDTCGTGGDGSGTFNISTVSAFVAAGAGCKVAKHGNRAVSSRCGSAELLERLGIGIEESPERTARNVEQCGVGFLFAPMYHRATRHALNPRREIGIRSMFNIVGPLTHPAGVKRQVLGVFDAGLTETVAHVLCNLGSVHCMVVHGMEGLDEISLAGETRISELKDGSVRTSALTPELMGLEYVATEQVGGGDSAQNARIAMEVLSGGCGPHREIVLANAGAAIYVGGEAESIREGVALARKSIDSQAAMGAFEKLKGQEN